MRNQIQDSAPSENAAALPITSSRSWKTAASLILTLLYPILVYAALTQGRTGLASGLLILLLLLRAEGAPEPRSKLLYFICAGALMLVAILSLPLASTATLFYPVLVNSILGATFAFSLIKGPSVVWRIASARRSSPPPEAKRYCDRVTLMWTVFFCLNGLAALWTVLHGDLALWTLYNGAISYGIIGLLFGGEYLVRQRVTKHFGHT
jgi:uncharacterized membrane protein